MSGAHALIEALKRENVDVIFGIPGGALLPVYDVLYDSDIRHVLARHEQCAAHMADGFARASGRVGVCMATSGPGATNLVTGISSANIDSSPIVALTGQVPTSLIGGDAFQEVDIIGITASITKHNFQARKASDIPKMVKAAFYIASAGKPGAVLIDLPKDAQLETADIDFSEEICLRGYKPASDPDPTQIEKAVDLLIQAERPVIMSGGGVIISGASRELQQLAEFLLAPVTTSFMGKGSIPEDHPLCLGQCGMHGTGESNSLVMESDVLLAVGSRFSDRTTGRLEDFCRGKKIIHINIEPSEIGKNVFTHVPVVADAKKALKAIYERLIHRMKKKENSPWFERVKQVREEYQSKMRCDETSMKPPRLMKELRKILPNDAIVTTEVGQCQMWAALFFKTYKPRTFIGSGGQGTMGWGFPAAIGAKVAKPEVPVVDIAGDGSFRMTENSLATSVLEGIPVTVIILNNSMLGMVAQWQRLFCHRRYSSVKLGESPDFVKLAEAYGAEGYRPGSLEEFSSIVKKAIKNDVTTIIDVPVNPEENVFPMVPGGKGLGEVIWEEPR